MTIKQVIMTENRCYKRGERIKPRGIVLHSTDANNPYISRYVQPDPDGTIGKNLYGNHWNQERATKCMHGFLGLLADGETVAFVQNLPWDYRCWGCGGDESGSYNDSHIQFEICEDGLEDAAYYWAAFDLAAEVCAMLCREYGIRTVNIVSHGEAAAALYASGHIDPSHWMAKHGDSMDAFRARVSAMIGEDTTVRPTWDEERRDTVRKGAKSAAVAELQGILIALGYDLGKTGADGHFGSETRSAVRAFQADHELVPDGVAGEKTWRKALELIEELEAADKPDEGDKPPQSDGAAPGGAEGVTSKVRTLEKLLTQIVSQMKDTVDIMEHNAEQLCIIVDSMLSVEGGVSDG